MSILFYLLWLYFTLTSPHLTSPLTASVIIYQQLAEHIGIWLLYMDAASHCWQAVFACGCSKSKSLSESVCLCHSFLHASHAVRLLMKLVFFAVQTYSCASSEASNSVAA